MFANEVSCELGGRSVSRSISLMAENSLIGPRKASLIRFANSVGRRLSVFSIWSWEKRSVVLEMEFIPQIRFTSFHHPFDFACFRYLLLRHRTYYDKLS